MRNNAIFYNLYKLNKFRKEKSDTERFIRIPQQIEISLPLSVMSVINISILKQLAVNESARAEPFTIESPLILPAACEVISRAIVFTMNVKVCMHDCSKRARHNAATTHTRVYTS